MGMEAKSTGWWKDSSTMKANAAEEEEGEEVEEEEGIATVMPISQFTSKSNLFLVLIVFGFFLIILCRYAGRAGSLYLCFASSCLTSNVVGSVFGTFLHRIFFEHFIPHFRAFFQCLPFVFVFDVLLLHPQTI